MIKIIALSLILTTILIYTAFSIVYHLDTMNEQKITYKQFKAFYTISPEKWQIIDGCHYFASYNANNGHVNIYMRTYFENILLGKQLKKDINNHNNLEYTKARSKLISEWQNDIANYSQKSVGELRKKLKENKQ